MYYEGNYKVKSVTETEDGKTFCASQHTRSGLGKYRNIRDIRVPDGVDVQAGDVVKLKVENHSDESGESSRRWTLERFIGFPYEKERGWDYFNGLGNEDEDDWTIDRPDT